MCKFISWMRAKTESITYKRSYVQMSSLFIWTKSKYSHIYLDFLNNHPETRAPLQKSDPVRPTFRWRSAHGVQRFHAATTQFQASVLGLRRRQAEVIYHTHLPVATASLFRFVLETNFRQNNYYIDAFNSKFTSKGKL